MVDVTTGPADGADKCCSHALALGVVPRRLESSSPTWRRPARE